MTKKVFRENFISYCHELPGDFPNYADNAPLYACLTIELRSNNLNLAVLCAKTFGLLLRRHRKDLIK